MTNIAAVLKSEISRLARKQSRAKVEGLKKIASLQRTEVALLKKRVQDLEKAVKTLVKIQTSGECWRRFKIEPPCRLNFEPGLLANL